MQPSATIAMDARAKALVAQGIDIVNLTAGEPDFETLPATRAGGIAAIESGFTRYPPVAGIPELRAAIAEKLEKDNGIDYKASQVVVSDGAKQSIYNALMVLLDPGDKDVFVISDEIYEKLTYGSEFISIASLGPEIRERTVTVNGFSKAYAMTGWRMGYAAATSEIAEAMSSFQSQCTSGASSISQKAALAALKGDQAPVEAMRVQFDRRRLYVAGRLEQMPGVHLDGLPEGAFYIFPRVDELYGKGVSGSVAFAEALLERARVAVVPGLPFGSDRHIRLSYACSLETLTEGMDRLEAFARSLAEVDEVSG